MVKVVIKEIRKGKRKEREDKQKNKMDLGIVIDIVAVKIVEKCDIISLVQLGF
jgi:hypothetical protein